MWYQVLHFKHCARYMFRVPLFSSSFSNSSWTLYCLNLRWETGNLNEEYEEKTAIWHHSVKDCLKMWVIGMLLVSRFGLVEEDAVDEFHYNGFTCPLLSWCKISSPIKENNNVILFLFPFHIIMSLANLWFIHLQGYFQILMTMHCPGLWMLIRPSRRPLVLGTGRILIPS